MQNRKFSILALSFILFVFSACGTARLVKTSPGKGGEIAVAGDREKAMEQARAMMANTCGSKKPEVVEEGEAVIGETTNRSGSMFSTYGTSNTQQRTEWRIKFECK
jgi:hypothetical protein